MRRLTAILCLTVAVLLGSAGVSWGGTHWYHDGLSAYKRGDFTEAFRAWKNMHEQWVALGEFGAEVSCAPHETNGIHITCESQYYLGILYLNGKGVPQDDKIALKYFRTVAERGYPDAQTTVVQLRNRINQKELADIQKGDAAYESGDYATALREFTPLAKQDNAIAQYALGWMYYAGEGVAQDYKTAAKWLTLSAEQGFSLAQYNLGIWYINGEGVPQNNKIALKWFKLTAKQGNKDAQKAVEELQTKVDEELEAERIAKGEERKSNLETARGKWGLKFGMNGMEAAQINNNKVMCSSQYNKITCKLINGGSLGLYFLKNDFGDCPCDDLQLIRRHMGKYTRAAQKKYLGILNKNYELILSPTEGDVEKFAFGFGDGYLEYIFKNEKNKTDPLFINLILGERITLEYWSEQNGKEKLRERSAKRKQDEDL